MKGFYSIIISILCATGISQSVIAQDWLPMDKGVDCFYNGNVRRILVDSLNDKLYISGAFNHDGNCNRLRGIAYWTGVNWDSIGNATEGNAAKAAMCLYNNSLYLYGIFYDTNLNQYLAKWDGLVWDTIPQSPNNTVTCFLEKDGILYIGGGIDHLGNDSTFLLGKYDGSSFSGLTPYYGSQSGNVISCMAFYQDTLYVGGNFHMMPYKNLSDFAKFDGTDLQIVSNDFANLGSTCLIETMVTYKNELYVGGYFQKMNGYAGDYIMKWNGNTFSEVGNGVNGRITCMRVYNDELYVGGSFTQAGAVISNNIAKWDGTNWYSLTTDSFTGSYPMIMSLNFYRDSLIIGGTFTSINGDSTMQRVARYSQPITNIGTNNKPIETLSLHPNPTSSQITLEFDLKDSENTSIEITNTLGQTVYLNRDQFPEGNNKIELDVSGFPVGMYFVRIKNKTAITSGKFIRN